MSRRAAARMILGIASATALAACANQTADQLTADVNLILNGLNAIPPTLAGLPANLQPSADVMAKIQAAIDDVRTNAAAVGTALMPNADVVAHIAQVISTLSALLAAFFPVAPIINEIVQAILALVPTILAIANVPAPASAKRSTVAELAAARAYLAKVR